MKTKAALAKREQLREEAGRARAAALTATTRIREIEARTKELERNRVAALKGAVRTGRAPDVEEIDSERAELDREAQQLRKEAAAAREAQREADREFERLHREEFEALSEHAESLTVEAMERLAGIEDGYRGAYAAWQAARSEWNALAHYNGLEPCLHGPLPEPGHVFAAAPPRPPEVHVENGPGPVDPESQPEAGSERTWESRDGRTITARVGDTRDRTLDADPEWEVVSG